VAGALRARTGDDRDGGVRALSAGRQRAAGAARCVRRTAGHRTYPVHDLVSLRPERCGVAHRVRSLQSFGVDGTQVAYEAWKWVWRASRASRRATTRAHKVRSSRSATQAPPGNPGTGARRLLALASPQRLRHAPDHACLGVRSQRDSVYRAAQRERRRRLRDSAQEFAMLRITTQFPHALLASTSLFVCAVLHASPPPPNQLTRRR
jgi:hypothetical protein